MDDVLAIPAPPGTLPAHSPLGASSAERWMNCPGSVTLADLFRSSPGYVEDDPDYRKDGTQAHELAAHCLDNGIDAWEADANQFPDLTSDMMNAVQEYLDYVRAQPGTREVEVRVHLPDFHPSFYGTLDCVVVDREASTIHVIDYKHGVGIVVDAIENPQLMYYAYGKIGDRENYFLPNDVPVKLTIGQPRAIHRDGTFRTWETTVGHIREWAETVLKPAMEVTQDIEYLELGEHCRFCPAKMICPAFDGLAKKALRGGVQLTYAEAQQLKMIIKAVEEDTMRRLLAGERPEDVGAKLVKKRSFRVFKGGAPIEQTFGDDAWEKKLRSPAAIEKLPGGKAFVSEWAFMPDSDGYTVAPLNDQRTATSPKNDVDKWGDPAKWAIDGNPV
ncbi:MAG: DUF2800 domain-containing protein [Alphaproteobacteria bacterium]